MTCTPWLALPWHVAKDEYVSGRSCASEPSTCALFPFLDFCRANQRPMFRRPGAADTKHVNLFVLISPV